MLSRLPIHHADERQRADDVRLYQFRRTPAGFRLIWVGDLFSHTSKPRSAPHPVWRAFADMAREGFGVRHAYNLA